MPFEPSTSNSTAGVLSEATLPIAKSRGEPGRKKSRSLLLSLTSSAIALLAAMPVMAQEINGVPGSPSATTTIDGKQLPPPPMPFGGVIKEKASESTPWWPPRVVPPKGAPNVLLIMTEHVRRRHTHSHHGSHRARWLALHELPLHVALLTDAGGDYHGAQPSLSG